MKPTNWTVRPYRHSSTSKFVVTWSTGSRPRGVAVVAWDKLNPDASTEDRARYLAGDWRRHRKFFGTKDEAQRFASSQKTKLSNEGTRGLALPDDVRVMAAKCSEQLKPFGYTIAQAVEHFIDYLKVTRRSVTVTALIAEYTTAKKQKGNKERSLKDISYRLHTFEKRFGEMNVATITTAQIDDWLASLGLSGQSQNNYRAVVRAFFEYAVRRDYAKANPVVKIDKVRVDDKPAGIFTPAQLARLLNAAAADTLPALVIGAFAGLRQAEIFRLEWKEVDLARGFIEVTAKKSKTAQRRLVTIRPNLLAWLTPFAGRTGLVWPFTESQWRIKLDVVREAAELAAWPANGLRHSFGSYHLAKFSNANALALEMGHTTTKLIFSNYREVVRPDEAERYWNIRPQGSANLVPMEVAS
jgi:integrase